MTGGRLYNNMNHGSAVRCPAGIKLLRGNKRERTRERESDGRKIVYESWFGREVPRGNKAAEREQERERVTGGRLYMNHGSGVR